MDDFGKVSIITPSYNCEHFVGQMIESVLAQTYTNWELLITDDCSTDKSWDIIMEYAARDSRIRIFSLEVNSGAGVARNNSIKEANGRFIAFVDSDDYWMPQKLEKQLSFMVSHNVAMSYTSHLYIDKSDEVFAIVASPKRQSYFQTMCDDKIGFSTLVYDTNHLPKIMMPTLRKRQDWGMVLQLLKRCKYAYGIKEPLMFYRRGYYSLSSNKLGLIKYNIAVYQQILGWPLITAILFFIVFYLPSYALKNFEYRRINR